MTPEQFIEWRAEMGRHQSPAKSKISQQRAADLLGKSKSTIEKYESGAVPIGHEIDLACAALIAGIPPYSERE